MPFANKFGGGSAKKFGFSKSSKVKVEIEYLVIAGGGGGGLNGGGGGPGGGGAGGYRSSVVGQSSGGGASAETKIGLTKGMPYTVTVGGGGLQAADCDATGSNGNNSSIVGDEVSIISLGGGGGNFNLTQVSGGSGGGTAGLYATPPGINTRAPGTAGQGFDGGLPNHVSPGGGGGGGGAGALGGSAIDNKGGDGGAGVSSNITGTAVTRGGGGGGGVMNFGNTLAGTRGAGGSGGGGYGGRQEEQGQSGSGNTGGGGGAGGNDAQPCAAGAAGNGGSGIVVIRWVSTLPAATATTGSPTYNGGSGGYHIYTFNGIGSITP